MQALDEVKVLFRLLDLGDPPPPFEYPHPSRTLDERAQHEQRVLQRLTGQRLARGNRLEPELEDVLITFGRASLAIMVVGAVDGDDLPMARVCRHGHDAVVAVRSGTSLIFTEIRPTAFIAAADSCGAARRITTAAISTSRPTHQVTAQPPGRSEVIDTMTDIVLRLQPEPEINE